MTAQQGAIGRALRPLLRRCCASAICRSSTWLDGGPVRVVDGVSLRHRAGARCFGLVGESGSGKSTLAQALPRLLLPPALITGGQVRFDGRDLLALDERPTARRCAAAGWRWSPRAA